MNPTISTYAYNSWTVLDVKDRIDDTSARVLRTRLREEQEGSPLVALRLSEAVLAGTRWLSAISDAHQFAVQRGGSFAVISLDVSPGLSLLRYTMSLLVCPTLEDLTIWDTHRVREVAEEYSGQLADGPEAWPRSD